MADQPLRACASGENPSLRRSGGGGGGGGGASGGGGPGGGATTRGSSAPGGRSSCPLRPHAATLTTSASTARARQAFAARKNPRFTNDSPSAGTIEGTPSAGKPARSGQ